MISCLCPTFGRGPSELWLLEEAIESFLRQDRPAESELMILNDCPGQILMSDHPDVRVFNLPKRLPTLGDKFNHLVELARGDLLLPWEDDDISLPGRINQAVAQIGEGDYWKPPQVWYMDGRGLHWRHAVGVRHHASVFTRAAWEHVGGYPSVSGNQDAIMDARLGGHLLPAFPQGLPPDQWQYIYRWGVSSLHLSGCRDTEAAYRIHGTKPHAEGVFALKPHWRRDYVELVRAACPG